ncbi:MAG TPA: potassium-transporting ATPase subunit KdpC [Syntrophales bacterium]|nr:potassium-transporting ATPase subunit KdpC [Syntrophales bacterium]
MLALIKKSFLVLAVWTFITGALYPLAVTGVAKVFFPFRSEGSIIISKGVSRGSALIGQYFDGPRYFHSRPSATGPFPYNAASSAASNLGPLNPNLEKTVKERVKALRSIIPAGVKIPVDLVTSSGSGLDPHICPAAAFLQAASVAGARNADEAKIRALVDKHREDKLFGIFGETVVNVVKLNIALDELP